MKESKSREYSIDDVQRDFGSRLKQWLKRRGHKQASFAHEFMDTGRLSKICDGQINIELKTMLQLTNRLGISLAEFYADNEAAIIERDYPDHFRQFREVFVSGDKEALQDVMKAVRHALLDAEERKARGQPHPVPGKEGGPDARGVHKSSQKKRAS